MQSDNPNKSPYMQAIPGARVLQLANSIAIELPKGFLFPSCEEGEAQVLLFKDKITAIYPVMLSAHVEMGIWSDASDRTERLSKLGLITGTAANALAPFGLRESHMCWMEHLMGRRWPRVRFL